MQRCGGQHARPPVQARDCAGVNTGIGQWCGVRLGWRNACLDNRALARGINCAEGYCTHAGVAEATGNPHFLALIEFLFNFLIKATLITRSYEATKVALSQQVKEEHLLIVDAISRQDSEAARQAARQHMEGASRRLGSVDLKRFIAQNENLDGA